MANKEDHAGTNGALPTPLEHTEYDDLSHTNGVTPTDNPAVTAPSAVKQAKKFTITEPANEDIGDDPNLVAALEPDDGPEDGNTPMEIEIGKKKKKKTKPKSKRGLNAPTGFEEYYVDAPLTPAEHDEERKIYDPEYRFTQRIEQAIQRFVAKRKFDADGTTLFDKYLLHGGIKGGPKMFGGLDTETLNTKSAAEIAELAATHYVDPDKVDAFESTYVVDFEGCLSSFLSGRLAGQWDLPNEDKVKYLVGIIRNFFNYLLYHDVCPEYKDQINAARTLCDKAVPEIWNTVNLTRLLPGDFNMACSEIFGGSYQGIYSTDRAWMGDLETERCIGISPERARNIFKIGIAANASDDMFSRYRQQLNERTCRLVCSRDIGFEITEIVPANDIVLNLYGQQQCMGLQPIGKLKAKTWFSPHAPEEDLTEDEEAYLEANPPVSKSYEFWLEDEILERCTVGMKFEATIRETSFGLTYFDAVHGVHCSFYKMLPNEMMSDWKEIENEWLPMKKRNMLPGNIEDEDQNAGLGDAGENGQSASVKEVDGAANEGTTAGTMEIEPEAENVNVNTNIVAAGYDDDFEEVVKMEAKLQQTSKQREDGAEEGFGVEVHKAGAELAEVAGNPVGVVLEVFDVKRTTE